MSKSKVVALVLGLAAVMGLGVWGSPADGEAVIPQVDVPVKVIPSYALDIQPVLERSCGQCHGSGAAAPAGVQLTTYEGLMRGSVNGPMVIPGNPGLSSLVAHLKKEVDPELWRKCSIPGLEPTPNQVRNLERWIAAGARNN
jgi:hypothetical protein